MLPLRMPQRALPQFTLPLLALPLLAACASGDDNGRGVDHNETLLSVSATGEADTTPDEARFQAGINNWARSAKVASEDTQKDIAGIVEALRGLGIEDKDIQTRTINVQMNEWGPRKGQYQASNTVSVRVRDLAKADMAVATVTEAGANIISGPELRLSDPEKAANSAYGNAYRAALARAEAYAEAAGMEVSRVLYIRDAGGTQGSYRYLPGAIAMESAVPPPVAPPPPISMAPRPESGYSSGTIMPGQTTSAVSVQVDFALREK